MGDFINFLSNWWHQILVIVVVIGFVIYGKIMEIDASKRIYLAQRNEEISRISEGVAGGIIAVFENQNFIQALNNGVVIKIDINVDGSQNIVIAGKNNQVSR